MAALFLLVLGLAGFVAGQDGVCVPALRGLDDTPAKDVYRVGVLAIRGFDAAYAEFNRTFSDYLTATAGQRFTQPIHFEMVPLNFILLFTDVEDAIRSNGMEGVDFIYVNPSAFSCIESEYGANTLVSQVSRRVVDGQEYELTKFGGVIFTRTDNDRVHAVEDIRDRSVACASISGLGSGQMQFRLLQQRGLSYIQDPKQVVFTSNQGLVVNGVLQGLYDVGFVRTDQIERTLDSRTGELVNRTELKIIEGHFEIIDGMPFPFESSTILYPEWNVASLPHVPNDVAVEVQAALLDLADHAEIGRQLSECIIMRDCPSDADFDQCSTGCFSTIDTSFVANCDTNPELATLALEAKTQGGYTAWRSTLSYMELRNMQQETNFIRQEASGINACVRSQRIYDAIVCPPGHFRRPQEAVETGCADAGLDCGDHQCVCKPCVRGFDVDIFPLEPEYRSDETDGPCPKFSVCGRVAQNKQITFVASDNKERDDADLSANVLIDDGSLPLEVRRMPGKNFSYEFTFDATGRRTGVVIIEVFAGLEQIPESPFRLEILQRECGEETGDRLREADDFGDCVCSSGSITIGSRCVQNTVLITSVVVPALILLLIAVYIYVERKRKQADSVWAVKPEELRFDDPPAILGRGTFGLVLLAEYRGTQVAVKRVIPPKIRRKLAKKSSSSWRNSILGEGDAGESFGEINPGFAPIGETEFDEQLDAMESGDSPCSRENIAGTTTNNHETYQDNGHTNKSRPRVSRRKSEIDITFAKTEMNRDAYFDFDNLEEVGKQHHGFDGLQSGVILQPTLRQQMRTSRRHSISSDINIDAIAKRHAQVDPFRPCRRGSNNSWGSPVTDSHIGLHKTATIPEAASIQPTTGDARPNRQMRRHSFGGGVPQPHATATFQNPAVERGTKHAELKDDSGGPCHGSIATYSNDSIGDIDVSDDGMGMKSGWGQGGGVSGSGSVTSVGFSNPMSGSISSFMSRMRTRIFGKPDEYAHLKAEFIQEMRHLSKLRHPCITTVMGAVISRKSEPMLVMECMEHGSLYDLLHNESMIVDGELVLPILRDIAQGVRFLHAADPQVVHGDLKAQNVLVDAKFRAKVADFGLSQKKKVGATGTPLWMAPELLRGESDNTAASDIYSFGVILYEVYSRKDPYEGEDHLEVLRQVASSVINKRPPIPSPCPPKVASIMTDCMVGDPTARPTSEELDVRLKRLDVENVEPGIINFSMQRSKDKRAARNEELLFDVFPQHVAEALRDGRRVEAEHFDCVTIFFSDIVGYTTISAKMAPIKVSDMLDRLYLKFDDLSRKHDIFKIETIGDAYMAVTNLDHGQPDHAARMARFSVDAVAAASETAIDLDDPKSGTIKIRVGFHSGPIVADVVGSRLPKYTLFGDTVNTASRMESNSIPGRIQCSDKSAEFIKAQDPEIPLSSRGKIHIKGKGEMHTFWVNEPDSLDSEKHVKFLPPEGATKADATKSFGTKSTQLE